MNDYACSILLVESCGPGFDSRHLHQRKGARLGRAPFAFSPPFSFPPPSPQRLLLTQGRKGAGTQGEQGREELNAKVQRRQGVPSPQRLHFAQGHRARGRIWKSDLHWRRLVPRQIVGRVSVPAAVLDAGIAIPRRPCTRTRERGGRRCNSSPARRRAAFGGRRRGCSRRSA